MRVRGRSPRLLGRCLVGVLSGMGAFAFVHLARGESYDVAYRVRVLAEKAIAEVEIEVAQSSPLLLEVSADLNGRHWFNFRGKGVTFDDGRFAWQVPQAGGSLRYTTTIDRIRDETEYDSRCAADWMLTRGEDLFPPMAARTVKGAEARATLEIDVPPRWAVVTTYPEKDGVFQVEQAGRRFDQPKGWVMAGDLDHYEDEIDGMALRVAAPDSHDVHLRDMVAFLRLVLPTLAEAAGTLPPRLTIVSADDPMWRGGLSGPESLYLHADRPLVDRDGSSPLLHEVVHVLTRARSAPGADWIVEGIAEWVSLDILRRSGAVSQVSFERSLEHLRKRGRRVKRFTGESHGAETARAVGIIASIDETIRVKNAEASFDDVLGALAAEPIELDRAALIALVLRQTGVDVSGLVPD